MRRIPRGIRLTFLATESGVRGDQITVTQSQWDMLGSQSYEEGVSFAQLRADQAAQRLGSLAEIRGAAAVAEFFKGRVQAAKPALVDGAPALAVVFGGQLRIVVRLTIRGERISAIDAVADAEQIGEFDVTLLA